MSVLRTLVLGATGLGLLAHGAAAAERRPLSRPEWRVEVDKPLYSIHQEPGKLAWKIRYQVEGKSYSTEFRPPIDLEALVKAEVEFDGKSGVYRYRYRVENSPASHQLLQGFTVGFSHAIFDLARPEGWSNGPASFDAIVDWARTLAEPYGLPAGSGQDGFAFSASELPRANAFTDRASGKAGVFFETGSLPGVVPCYVSGATDDLEFPVEPPDGISSHFPRFPADGLSGRTVGPVAAPARPEPAAFLETLLSYVRIALEEGWVRDADTAERLEAKINALETAFGEGDRPAYLGLLGSLSAQATTELEAGKLTPEAYALVKFNVDYLLRKR
ncbi:MAG: hypothetical protein U0002_13700 [Thermoanaerobaculia bacterium]